VPRDSRGMSQTDHPRRRASPSHSRRWGYTCKPGIENFDLNRWQWIHACGMRSPPKKCSWPWAQRWVHRWSTIYDPHARA